ncbi:hypothetical protein [Metabacillus litoralis]|uniref:hypothetical protein n=1 Tax=Metabacillus litoralis TaxID=152268 RepID=UPI0022B2D773|nr:hypothetical protein [Metabacillus litoralis]
MGKKKNMEYGKCYCWGYKKYDVELDFKKDDKKDYDYKSTIRKIMMIKSTISMTKRNIIMIENVIMVISMIKRITKSTGIIKSMTRDVNAVADGIKG